MANNHIEVQDEKGPRSVRRSAHVKAIEPKDKIIQQMPAEEVLRQYGRGVKLLINRKDIPDLQLQALEADNAEINSVTIESDEDSSPQRNSKEIVNKNISLPTNSTEGDEHSTLSTTQSDKHLHHCIEARAEPAVEDSDEYSTLQQGAQLTVNGTDNSPTGSKG